MVLGRGRFENDTDFQNRSQVTAESHISHSGEAGGVFGHVAIHGNVKLIDRKLDYRTIVEVTCGWWEMTGRYYNIY